MHFDLRRCQFPRTGKGLGGRLMDHLASHCVNSHDTLLMHLLINLTFSLAVGLKAGLRGPHEAKGLD